MVLACVATPGLPRHLREIPIEYFERAFRRLETQPGVAPEDCALIGGSRGGELALPLASRYSQIRAVVAIDPASVLLPSPPTGFFDLLWRYVDGVPKQNAWTSMGQLPARTRESDMMSGDLKKWGFSFAGSAICYAFMRAVGMASDHVVHCYRFAELQEIAQAEGKRGECVPVRQGWHSTLCPTGPDQSTAQPSHRSRLLANRPKEETP